MTGVIYARYSSDNQREESIEGQLRECRQYADKNGITLLDPYIDRAFSAKTDNRPSFLKMIADSTQKKFDTVIVWKLDRFARNRYDSARYKAQLRKNGVRVVSATESISDGSEGILLESVLEGMAEYYSADLAEKVIRGMTENALKCKYNGGALLLGYTIDENHLYRLDPLVAPHILEAFRQYAAGKTMQEITNNLNNAGVRTYRGSRITFNIVTRMLHNRRYLGEYRYRDTVIPGGIPAIVPEELFNKVQERMAANAHAPARHKAEDEYLLTTKLFCGECKRMMVGESGTSQTGVIYRYYKCAGVKRFNDCHKKSVKKDRIEDFVLAQIRKVILDDETLNNIADRMIEKLHEENTTLPLLQRQLRETEKGIENFMNAIQMGIITASTKERLEALEAQKNELKLQIAQEEIANPTVTKEQIMFFLEKFRKLNPRILEHRRRLIDSFVNAIYLYDDRMLITFNCAEGAKTYSFSELEEAQHRSDLEAQASPIKNRHLQ